MGFATRVAHGVRRRLTGRPPGVPRYRTRWEPRDQRAPAFPGLTSQACSAAQIASPEYAAWCDRFGEPVLMHRKQWEWCFIAQALEEAHVLHPGSHGVGFGVGREPLTAVIATHGCEVVATDLAGDTDDAAHWTAAGQHAGALDDLNRAGLCPPDEFAARVQFRAVDMRAIPDDLVDFDFSWSCCAMEHLGDLARGREFFTRQLDCLRPGGIAVHTTEYNVGSDDETVEEGETVVYRRRDIEALVSEMRALGCDVHVTFGLGTRPEDRHIDHAPWKGPHLKIAGYGFVLTSFGLIVRAPLAPRR